MIEKANALDLQDESVSQGRVRTINFTGSRVAASASAGVGAIAISTPTGTGFCHTTAGAEDAASKLVDTADVNNDQITYAKMQNVAANLRVIGRTSGAGGDPEELTLTQVLDFVGSAAQGDILYRSGAGWVRLAAGTAGFHLQTNGAAADPSWVANRRIVELGSDVASTASTAFQNITGLSFAVTSGVNYRWQATILYTTSAATIGVRLACNGPAFTHNAYSSTLGPAVAGSAAAAWYNSASAYDTAVVTSSSMNTTGGNIIVAHGIVRPSANGTFILRFAPETATANGVVIETGSTLEWW